MMLFRQFLLTSLYLVQLAVSAQFERHALYDYAAPRANPAYFATGTAANLNFLYRNQQSVPGVQTRSAYVAAKYPFLRKNGPWSGLGVELFNGVEGVEGILQTLSLGGGYGLNIPIAKFQSVSVGVSINYLQRSINTAALLTGNQFVEGFGFDPSLNSGENLDVFQVQYLSANWGVRWHSLDRKRRAKNHLGIALYNLNTPSESFIDDDNAALPITFISEGLKRIYESRNWLIALEAYMQSDGISHLWMIGGTSRLDLGALDRSFKGQTSAASLRYLHYRGIQLGIEWENNLFAIATSYELPLGGNAAQSGAFEVGIKLKKQVKAKAKRRQGRSKRLPPAIRKTQEEDDVLTIIGVPDSLGVEESPDAKPNLAAEVDTSKVYVVHIEFGFGSSKPTLERETQVFMAQLAVKLREDPALAIEIVGHTDDVGTRSFNQVLSENRAKAVYNLLIMRGVSFDQMIFSGRGELDPLVANSNELNRAKNRRVEIRFTAKD